MFSIAFSSLEFLFVRQWFSRLVILIIVILLHSEDRIVLVLEVVVVDSDAMAAGGAVETELPDVPGTSK